MINNTTLVIPPMPNTISYTEVLGLFGDQIMRVITITGVFFLVYVILNMFFAQTTYNTHVIQRTITILEFVCLICSLYLVSLGVMWFL